MDWKGEDMEVGKGTGKIGYRWIEREEIWKWEREQENIGYRWIGREEIWKWEREQENIGYRWIRRRYGSEKGNREK